MLIRKIALLFIALLAASYALAQTSPIDSIATKYRNWLTGEGVDYSRPEINQRYIRFLSASNGAHDLTGYDLANPGPVWDFSANSNTDQTAYSRLVEQKLIYLTFLYQIKGPVANPNPGYHRVTLRDTILSIFNYLKVKGINSNTNFNVSEDASQETLNINNSGPALRSYAYAIPILLMKAELIAAGEFNHHMGALNRLTYYIAPGNPNFHFTYPGFNTDVTRATVPQRLCYVLAQDDTSSTRTANMAYLRNFTDNALLIGYGWSDCIKPDFMTYHHRGPYPNSYGKDMLLIGSVINKMLKGSSYELSATAQNNLKEAMMAYGKFSSDFTQPRGLAGRFPTSTNSLQDLRAALAYLYAADPVACTDAGKEFKRLWNISASGNLGLQRSIGASHTLGGMQDMLQVLDAAIPASAAPEGQFSFPYAGLSVHKQDRWLVSVKGTSKHIWHFENSNTENRLGTYGSAGAMEILAKGNPILPDSNGLSFNGWDWAHIPGTTAANVPFTTMASYPAREMNGKNFLVHAALDKNGVFAMDYRDINSATGMTALKTCFFFNDKILCLGSNIKDLNGVYPIHTTLFQTSFFNTNNTSLVNGTVATGNNYTFNQTGGGLWATDAIGNGFIVPAGAFNAGNPIVITRSNQSGPDHSNTTTTTGDFAKAYIDHGAAPVAATYQYGVQVQGGSGTADFLANFNSYFTVLQQDSLAHIVKYVPDSVFSYVIFDTTAAPAADLLLKSNKPAVVMTQQLPGDKVKVSLTNPNLGLLAPAEAYTWGQISGTASRVYRIPQTDVVKITLQGSWQLDQPQPQVSVAANGANTDVSFSTKNGFTEQALLVRSIPLPLGITGFHVRAEGCAALLEWHIATTGYERIIVERATPGNPWKPIASTGPRTQQYRDEYAGGAGALYRLAFCEAGGKCDYSAVARVQLPEHCRQRQFRVWPNPVKNTLHIEVAAGKVWGEEKIRLMDTRGNKLSVPIRYQERHAAVDMRSLPAGMYFVTVGEAAYKVIKE